LTVEDMEGTEPAETEASADTQAAAPAPANEETAASTAQTAEAAQPDQPATTEEPAAEREPVATVATAALAEEQTAPAEEQTDPAEEQTAPADAPAAKSDDNGIVSASPSPEAAVGASGARPLGSADAIADRVEESIAEPAEPAEPSLDPTTGSPAADELVEAPPAELEAPAAAREGPEPTTMEELLREQQTEIRSLKHGDVVEGTVVRIDKDEILVDIGAKSEGVVSNRELYGRNAEVQPQLNVGDQVLVYVLQPESQEGHAVLSLRRAGLERKWRAMQEQLDAGAIIEAPVIDHNKGGLIVDCGIRGFVPISQIVDFPRRPQNEQPRDAAQEIAEKLQPYVGRKLRLKILEVNRKANRLILSEKVALYEERREKRDELFSSLQVGQRVTGTVRSIAPFGVFIDLGGIDGLVHKSELSWNKVNNPEAGYKIGEDVEAEVIDVNHERGRISLSIRRLQPDPWHTSVADLKVGDIVEGTVTKIVNFGSFVRVRDGLEGLIHISELSHQRIAHPGDVVHEGQRLKLKVISLDSERHRLGLSLKQAEEPPTRPPSEARSERRPRQERGYDASQAVQEPEGGIDNTLAAAFAQVRQQLEESEAARREAEQTETADAGLEPSAEPTTAEAVAAPAADEATAEAAEAVAEPAADEATAEPTTAEAVAEPAPEPARRARRKSSSEGAEDAAADQDPAAGAAEQELADS
jgi:small subunit ribosomal protein S1